jgi:outer membrane protein assembly factor BamD
MKFRCARTLLILVCLMAFPTRSPAPLIYRPGEGWTYEPVGGDTKWQQTRAKDQLDVAQAAFDGKNYSLALKAAKRVVRVWPLSDYAPQAQYLVARCYEAKGSDEKAFKEYQTVLERYPKIPSYQDIVRRQFEIANHFLAGKRFRLWGVIPLFSSMDKTADMYDKIVKNGPYSDVAPQAQLNIGAAREKEKTFGIKSPDYATAAKAYELAADRYHDRPKVAAEGLFREGLAQQKQAQTADYDQSMASQAIATFTDFLTLYPDDPRANEAQKIITSLKREQARGNYRTARFYEKYKRWAGALVYYNEVVLQDPESPYAFEAQQRLDAIKKRIETAKK